MSDEEELQESSCFRLSPFVSNSNRDEGREKRESRNNVKQREGKREMVILVPFEGFRSV